MSCTSQLDVAAVKKLRCAIKTRKVKCLQGQEKSASVGRRDFLQATTMLCQRYLTSKHKQCLGGGAGAKGGPAVELKSGQSWGSFRTDVPSPPCPAALPAYKVVGEGGG